MKKDKDKIMFLHTRNRLFSDSRDTYYWLKLRDKKIAEEFRPKMEGMEIHFKKELKKTKEETNIMLDRMKEGEPKVVETKNDMTIKTWWKTLCKQIKI